MLCRLSPFFVKKLNETADLYQGFPWIQLTDDHADKNDIETFFQYLYHDKLFTSFKCEGSLIDML